MPDVPPIADTLEWLRDRGYYAGQIEAHRTEPGQEATHRNLDVHKSVAVSLTEHGITDLYEHQVAAVDAVRRGRNVVLETPTASGKSLAYTIPALERAVKHGGKTLYIAPTRALINDQHDTISAFADDLGFGKTATVAKKNGKTSKQKTRQIKRTQPDILLATVDQLHLSLTPFAHYRNHWRWLFQQLETVVIDEVHQYRGNFGTHTSLVFRRFARLLDHYETSPEFVCCSATIGNPVEHAAGVTGQSTDSFAHVDDDTSVTGDRHYLLWNPPLKEDAADDSGKSPANNRVRAGHDPKPPETFEADPALTDTPVDGGAVPVDTRAVTGSDSQRSRGDADGQPRALPAHDEVVGGERRSQHAQSLTSSTRLKPWDSSVGDSGRS